MGVWGGSCFFCSVHNYWCASPGFARWQSPISTSGMYWVVLKRSTPSLSYMPFLSCAVRSTHLGKPLFLLKTIVCLSFSGSFLSTHPPTRGFFSWDGGGRRGRECRCGGCLWLVVSLPQERLCSSHESRVWLGPGGSGDCTGRKDPPPPHLGRQNCVVVWLPTHPPTEGQGRHHLDFGQCQPLFVCPPPPTHGGEGICLLVWCCLPLIGGEMSATIAYGPW